MCQHQFFEIMKVSRATPPSTAIGNRWPEQMGAKCGCINCGEIRSVWEDGDVTVDIPGHDQTH